MKGYWRQPEATDAVIVDGWFHTGDMATMDAEGMVEIVDRKKDLIISGGENISSIEVEGMLYKHPKVLEAAAIAVPSELGEDEILVVAVARPGQVLLPQEIADWCADQLAPCKRPRYFAQADALPHTPTHRVAKFKLKEDPTLRQRAVELRSQR